MKTAVHLINRQPHIGNVVGYNNLQYMSLSPLSPNGTTFQEVWLRNVIDNKLAVSQAVCVN